MGSQYGLTGECNRVSRLLSDYLRRGGGDRKGACSMEELGQLSGGGPIPTNQGLPAAPNQAQLPALTIRLLPKVGTDKVQNTYQYGAAETTKTKGQPPALASMDSLRGPLARPNRANLHHNRDNGARDKTPVELRYPHNSKKWGLGVGQVPG